MKLIKYYKTSLNSIIKFPFLFTKYFLIGLKNIFLTLPKLLIYKFKKTPQKTSKIILFLSLTTYLICIFIITRWYVQNERTKKFTTSMTNNEITILDNNSSNEYQDSTNNIVNNNSSNSNSQNIIDNLNYMNVNLKYYIDKNKETVGWIQIKGTNINYPIVQTKNNDYYLKHDFYKRKSSVGWIFADYRNNFNILDNNTIIYGHNLINRTMFGEIPTFLKNNWLNKQNKPYIKLSTKNHNTIWQIFSIYKIKPTTDYLQAKFNSIENYTIFLNKIKNRSIKNLGTDVLPTDKIVTLSTCDDTGNYRVVVHAKLIKIENK